MKSWSITISESAFFKIAFAFSVLMLFAIATISFKQLQAANNAQNSVIQSRDRQIELEKLLSVIKDAERMQRGYIISGEDDYLKGYSKSRKRISRSFAKLQALINNNTLKQEHLEYLKQLTNRRLNILDEILILYKTNPSSSPQIQTTLKEGAVAMKQTERFVNRLIQNENRALHQFEAYHQEKNKFLPYTTGFLVVFALIIFFISFYKISKDSERHRKMNDDLMIVNKSFQYAEEISQMGHWKRNLITHKIESSDNMFRLFGVEPGSVSFNQEVLMQFVHPDDKAALNEALEKIKTDHLPPQMTYRIIHPDGEIRYLKSAAKLISINNIPMMLGATCDVTQQIEINRSLEQKNRELEAAVEELASFNHIASHDLQEPLRKIQMFISRISLEEADALSDTGREYFDRVSVSALRMEQLIDDLLLYSETNKEDQVFEKVDLNDIINEAKLELTTEIENKAAIISCEELPTLRAIPFQMRQLFINLIGNALKYGKNDIAPQVTISCKVLKAKDITIRKNLEAKNYYKITVADNGIGFKQEFAEKIFILFQRLHKKEHYSGTGIGLAICKKIVEIHKGFIYAESTPGEDLHLIFFYQNSNKT